MTLKALAFDHQQARVELSKRVARKAARLFRQIPVNALDAGWDRIAPELERVVALGQLTAARQATPYVNAALRGQDMDAPSVPLVPEAFTGVTLEGREIVPELYAAVATTKSLVRRGVGVPAAFQAGFAFMSVMAATIVRDAGNMADKTASVGKGGVLMARVVQPGACSRCAILAGVGHFTRHFERHPGCRCTTIPVHSESEVPAGVFSSPKDYFDSLTAGEQDRVFTKAGAEAIRLGADPISVVNSRRGMFRTQQPGSLIARATPRTVIGPDGVPFQAFTTAERTSRRSFSGGVRLAGDQNRRTRSIRLMPETIMSQAGGDAERARDLLRRYGYLR